MLSVREHGWRVWVGVARVMESADQPPWGLTVMCRTHRKIVIVSAVAWVVSTALMFTQLWGLPDPLADFCRVASVNIGALAACLTTVAVLPSLLREFYTSTVLDYVGSFLAGWASGQEVEPDEPTQEPTPLRLLG